MSQPITQLTLLLQVVRHAVGEAIYSWEHTDDGIPTVVVDEATYERFATAHRRQIEAGTLRLSFVAQDSGPGHAPAEKLDVDLPVPAPHADGAGAVGGSLQRGDEEPRRDADRDRPPAGAALPDGPAARHRETSGVYVDTACCANAERLTALLRSQTEPRLKIPASAFPEFDSAVHAEYPELRAVREELLSVTGALNALEEHRDRLGSDQLYLGDLVRARISRSIDEQTKALHVRRERLLTRRELLDLQARARAELTRP